MMRSNEPAALVLAVAAVLLSSCGKSSTAIRFRAVECAGYLQAMVQSTMADDGASRFLESVDATSKGHPSADAAKVNAASALGQQLASGLDPARSAAAAEDGGKAWGGHLRDRDAAGVVAFVDGCLANYDRLLAAAR